jgi:death-on-curing protein
MSEPIEYLDLDDLIRLARTLLGDPPPIRDVGLLGSAAARPQATAFGEDAYPDLLAKSAALLQSIVNSHALVDGNKRLGWLATAVFLELNGVNATRASNDDVYELVMWVAASNPDIDDIATRLRRVAQPRRR